MLSSEGKPAAHDSRIASKGASGAAARKTRWRCVREKSSVRARDGTTRETIGIDKAEKRLGIGKDAAK